MTQNGTTGLLLACVLGTGLAACGRDSPTAPDPLAQGLEIVSVPTSLLVGESALLTIRMRNPDGTEAQLPPDVQWRSSNEAVVRLQPASTSADRVITALGRGTVTLTVTAGRVAASAVLTVNARVGILPDGPTPCEFPLTVCVAIGERMAFTAVFVDVNGVSLGEATPSATWTSSAPDVASVTSWSSQAPHVGLVTGLRAGRATITASTSVGVGTLDVFVADVIQGGAALVRFAHADQNRGPLTFVPSRGAPVTLAFGESTDVPIASGTYGVRVDGLGPGWSGNWLVRDGNRLEVFATNESLTAGWTSQTGIPADSGLIRFVQAGNLPVVLIGAPGATVAESRLVECYFDPGAITWYVRVQGGELDVLGGDKNLLPPGTGGSARQRIRVTPGRAVTYAIIGDSRETMRVIAFPPF